MNPDSLSDHLRKAGQAKSEAKTAAVRENAKLPRKRNTILFQRPHDFDIGAEALADRWLELERELARRHEAEGKIGPGRDATIVGGLRREMQEALGLVVDPQKIVAENERRMAVKK